MTKTDREYIQKEFHLIVKSEQQLGVYLARELNELIALADSANINFPINNFVCYHHYNSTIE